MPAHKREALAAEQADEGLAMYETLLERATRTNFGRDPYAVRADRLGHRTRGSDASTFDEICITCTESDRRGSDALNLPCRAPLPLK